MDGEIEGVGSRCKGGRQVCAEHSGKPGGAFDFIYLYRRNDKNWKSLIFIFLVWACTALRAGGGWRREDQFTPCRVCWPEVGQPSACLAWYWETLSCQHTHGWVSRVMTFITRGVELRYVDSKHVLVVTMGHTPLQCDQHGNQISHHLNMKQFPPPLPPPPNPHNTKVMSLLGGETLRWFKFRVCSTALK